MSASARSGAKRLIKEMENWRKEQKDEKGVERLGPVNEDDLFEWEAVINGKGIGSGYDGEPFFLPTLYLSFTCTRRFEKKINRDANVQCHRGPMAHQHPALDVVPAVAPQDALRDANHPPQHCAADGRDLPRPAQGQVDADVQRAAVRARRAHAAGIPGDGQPAERGYCGAAEGR